MFTTVLLWRKRVGFVDDLVFDCLLQFPDINKQVNMCHSVLVFFPEIFANNIFFMRRRSRQRRRKALELPEGHVDGNTTCWWIGPWRRAVEGGGELWNWLRFSVTATLKLLVTTWAMEATGMFSDAPSILANSSHHAQEWGGRRNTPQHHHHHHLVRKLRLAVVFYQYYLSLAFLSVQITLNSES